MVNPEFPDVANLLFGQAIAENYMKMKNKTDQVEGETACISIALWVGE